MGGDEGEGEPKGLHLVHPHRAVARAAMARRATSPSPIEGGGNYWGDLKYLLLIITVYTIME